MIEKLNRTHRPDDRPNAKEERNNAVGDEAPTRYTAGAGSFAEHLYRTVYGVVPWRGRAGAELCGLIFNHSGRFNLVGSV